MKETQNFQLPLFPLQTVLFPTVPINLHIFEPRYQQMINLCIDEKSPFGVVLIREGVEALGPVAIPHSIGCTAQIIHVEKLSQGRMNITAIGKERFFIQATHNNLPYLTGNVSLIQFHNKDNKDLEIQASRLHVQVARYLDLLSKAMTKPIASNLLPTESIAKTYLSASILHIPLIEKQKILEINDGVFLVKTLRQIYNRETAILQALIRHEGKFQGGFGLN